VTKDEPEREHIKKLLMPGDLDEDLNGTTFCS
jgi:hypothetical protein